MSHSGSPNWWAQGPRLQAAGQPVDALYPSVFSGRFMLLPETKHIGSELIGLLQVRVPRGGNQGILSRMGSRRTDWHSC